MTQHKVKKSKPRRFDPATGQVTVVSSASQPVFSNVNLLGASLVFRVTDGPPGSPCYIMASADLSLPKAAWTRIATNSSQQPRLLSDAEIQDLHTIWGLNRQ